MDNLIDFWPYTDWLPSRTCAGTIRVCMPSRPLASGTTAGGGRLHGNSGQGGRMGTFFGCVRLDTAIKERSHRGCSAAPPDCPCAPPNNFCIRTSHFAWLCARASYSWSHLDWHFRMLFQSSKLERLISLKRGKRDVRALSFEISKMSPQLGLAINAVIRGFFRGQKRPISGSPSFFGVIWKRHEFSPMGFRT